MRMYVLGLLIGLISLTPMAAHGLVGPDAGASGDNSGQSSVSPPNTANQCPTCGKSKVVNEGGKTYIVRPNGTKVEVKVK